MHRLLVDGVHAFDYRSQENFVGRTCGPYWSKGWQGGKSAYTTPPIYFAHESTTATLWLHLDDQRDPNEIPIDFNSRNIGGKTLVQKDLGAYWNQQEIVVSDCRRQGCWSRETLGAFFPTRFNLLRHGDRYTVGFEGLTDDPKFGTTPATRFVLQRGSPAIDAGVANTSYYQGNVADESPDLGAMEHGQTIADWRAQFGHLGPRWITAANAADEAAHRPAWPKELDKRWGGLVEANR